LCRCLTFEKFPEKAYEERALLKPMFTTKAIKLREFRWIKKNSDFLVLI